MRFIITCLLMFTFSFADEIKTLYKVLDVEGDIARRTDIVLDCSEKDNYKSLPYKLKIKKDGSRVNLLIRLKAKSFKITQNLRKGQSVSDIEIDTFDKTLTKKFEYNTVEITLPSEDILEIRYSIKLNNENSNIILPVVESVNVDKTCSFKLVLPVFFQKGSTQLDEKAVLTIQGLDKNILQKCRITVIGYSDKTPTIYNSISNLEIARQRAESVKNFLERYLGE